MSVSERTVREWLSRIDKDSKEARNKRIFDLWLACHNQHSAPDHNRDFAELAELPDSAEPAANHLTDFQIPIYNVWKQQEKTPGSGHFGNSEVRWVDNLLHLYTSPFDAVVRKKGAAAPAPFIGVRVQGTAAAGVSMEFRQSVS